VDGFGAAYHVLPVSRHINTKRRAWELDRTDQVHITIEDHYFRPVMELGTPRSESHHSAVVVGFRANWGALERATAGHWVGTDHLGVGDVEQENLAREPVDREIPGKRSYRGAVSRDYGRPAEPVIRLTEVNHSLVSRAIIHVNIKTEAISNKHVPIARNPVKNVTGSGAGDTEYDVAAAGIDQGGEIILRDECDRTVIGQIDSIHSKRIRPHESHRAPVSASKT